MSILRCEHAYRSLTAEMAKYLSIGVLHITLSMRGVFIGVIRAKIVSVEIDDSYVNEMKIESIRH